jgi:hypothetical protein
MNLSKKQAELVGSKYMGGIFSTMILKYVSFAIAIKNSNKFALKKMIW